MVAERHYDGTKTAAWRRRSEKELSVEERNPLSVAHKNAGAAWRNSTSVEQTKYNEQQAAYTREYVAIVETELQKTCDDIFTPMEKNLRRRGSPEESGDEFREGVGYDRTSVLSFPSGTSSYGDRYAPQSVEIVGILKQFKDETTADLNAPEKEGQKTVELP